jgi:cytochrome c oxidase subunit 3
MSAVEQVFPDRDQRRGADRLGMFVFLGSEIMLFGGIFALLAFDRIHHPGAAAVAAQHLKIWFGTANTAILLTSSLLVAVAALAAREGRAKTVALTLALAVALGVAFIGVKGVEYRLEYLEGLFPVIGPPSPLGDRPASLFIGLYFISTALHAVHVSVGIALLSWAAIGVARGRLRVPQRRTTIHLVGLYWHLVDVIWIFLYPLLYLARA